MRAGFATAAATAANPVPPSAWPHYWQGDALEYGFGVLGLAILALAVVRRRRWLQRLAPALPGPPVNLLVFVALVCACVGVAYLASSEILHHMPGAGFKTQLFLGVLTLEGAFFGAIALYHFGYRKLALSSAPLRTARFGPVVFLAAMPIVLILSEAWDLLLQALGHPVTEQALIDQFRALDTWPSRALFVVFATMLAPITEEIIFRGVIYRGVAKLAPRWVAVVISAGLFGAAHTDLSTLVPLFALGALFALAYDATGCIWVTIIAHALFNLNTIVALFLGVGS